MPVKHAFFKKNTAITLFFTLTHFFHTKFQLIARQTIFQISEHLIFQHRTAAESNVCNIMTIN
jgi:hypothetical protein